jgi:hypothetical protein
MDAPQIVLPPHCFGGGHSREGAGIQMPFFNGEEFFAEIRKIALDIGPQFEYSAY